MLTITLMMLGYLQIILVLSYIFVNNFITEACASGYVKDIKCEEARKSLHKGRPCDIDTDCALVNSKNDVIGYSEC